MLLPLATFEIGDAAAWFAAAVSLAALAHSYKSNKAAQRSNTIARQANTKADEANRIAAEGLELQKQLIARERDAEIPDVHVEANYSTNKGLIERLRVHARNTGPRPVCVLTVEVEAPSGTWSTLAELSPGGVILPNDGSTLHLLDVPRVRMKRTAPQIVADPFQATGRWRFTTKTGHYINTQEREQIILKYILHRKLHQSGEALAWPEDGLWPDPNARG